MVFFALCLEGGRGRSVELRQVHAQPHENKKGLSILRVRKHSHKIKHVHKHNKVTFGRK